MPQILFHVHVESLNLPVEEFQDAFSVYTCLVSVSVSAFKKSLWPH